MIGVMEGIFTLFVFVPWIPIKIIKALRDKLGYKNHASCLKSNGSSLNHSTCLKDSKNNETFNKEIKISNEKISSIEKALQESVSQAFSQIHVAQMAHIHTE